MYSPSFIKEYMKASLQPIDFPIKKLWRQLGQSFSTKWNKNIMYNKFPFLVDKLFMVAGRNIQAVFLNLYKVFYVILKSLEK